MRDYGDDIYVVSIEDELELTYAELNQLVEIRRPVGYWPSYRRRERQSVWRQNRSWRPCCCSGLPNWSGAHLQPLIPAGPFRESPKLFNNTILNCCLSIPISLVMLYCPKNTTVISLESESVSAGRYVQFEDWLEDETAVSLPEAEPLRGSAAVILFTSGTNGCTQGGWR